MDSADRSVRRPTTAPIMSRGPPVVNCVGQEALEDETDRSPGENGKADRNREFFRNSLTSPAESARASYPVAQRKATGAGISARCHARASGRPSPTHASMKSSICRATVRISNSASTRLRPARARSARRSGASMRPPSAAAKAVGVVRVDRHRAMAAHLGEAAPPRGYQRRAARERFQRRAAERLGASVSAIPIAAFSHAALTSA